LATDDDIRRIFGSGNLLIGSLVRPTLAEPRKAEASNTEREPSRDTAEQ
jgi:hypothetical protein